MEGRELPVGWAEVPLGEVVDVLDSQRAPINTTEREARTAGKPQSALYPYYGATGQVGWIDDYIFSENLLLLGEDGVPFTDPLKRKAYRASGKFWVNNHAHVIKPLAGVCDQAYLESFLNQYDYTGCVAGSTRLKLTQAAMRQIPVPLAPFHEQRRIAAKLDTTLAAVEACRQRLDGVGAILKRFRQAVLAAATSGELTREWREARGIGHSWEDQALGNLLTDLRYGTAQKCNYDGCGNPVLRIPNILEGSIIHDDLKYAEFDQREIEKLAIHAGDLLIIRSNGSLDLVGRTALASEADEGFLFAGYLIRLRLRREVASPGFLLLVLLSPATRRSIELAARSTSGVNNINSKFLSGLQLELPSLEEQQEIVRRAKTLFTLADQLGARLNAARKVVHRLTPALLAKAFRGELVPQDPNDEPASVLLERIRAARQAEAGAGKPSRRGHPKAAANPDQINLHAAPARSEPLPQDLLTELLQECGALSERALLAASELEPGRFTEQLQLELQAGKIREELEEGERVLVVGG